MDNYGLVLFGIAGALGEGFSLSYLVDFFFWTTLREGSNGQVIEARIVQDGYGGRDAIYVFSNAIVVTRSVSYGAVLFEEDVCGVSTQTRARDVSSSSVLRILNRFVYYYQGVVSPVSSVLEVVSRYL